MPNHQAAFDTGDVNARGEPGKWAAPSRAPCRNDLARRLVEQGANVVDAHGARRTTDATRPRSRLQSS
ncbi:hypothetical protein WS88_16405 [Burkholderia cepacia]|nr:hypothetical protein WS88_16405 [Burkholderia cepacia]